MTQTFDPDDAQARAIQQEIYRRMTPGERWAEACKMYEFAWAAKAAGLRYDHPEWTEKQITEKVREIFLYATT